MATILHITQENFEEEVVNASKPVLLDYWADWCGPCRMLSPTIEEQAFFKDLRARLAARPKWKPPV